MTVDYDHLWRIAWGDMQRFGPVQRHSLKNLFKTVSSLEVHSILDVGCGSGVTLAAFAACGRYQLAGADSSEVALNLARKTVPSARLFHLDVEREALPEQFDLVISVQVVEHLLNDMTALSNIVKMARSYVFISTMQGRMRASEIAIGHVRNYSEIELRRKLECVGLQVLQVRAWGFPFYSPIYRSVVELLPGGPPSGPMGRGAKIAAGVLYQLYRLNWPGHGDVLSVLARPC